PLSLANDWNRGNHLRRAGHCEDRIARRAGMGMALGLHGPKRLRAVRFHYASEFRLALGLARVADESPGRYSQPRPLGIRFAAIGHRRRVLSSGSHRL